MGFEYRVLTTLSNQQYQEIENILEQHALFDKKYSLEHVQYWDFRHRENKHGMPDFTIAFEDNGLYICKHTNPNLWHDLTELKDYFASNNIDILIHED